MKRFLFILLHVVFFSTLYGQTIIDLKPGGGIRSKNEQDFQKENVVLQEKLKADSIQYNDNLTRALNALYRDSIDHAEELMNEALRLRPNAPSNFIIKHYLGRIQMSRGNFREAIIILSDLLKEQSENHEIRFERASCYLEIKNAQAALVDCEALFNKELPSEEQIKVLFLRSACNAAIRHPEKAKSDLEKILEIEPANESAQLLLAMTYNDLGQPMESLNRLNLFVSSHPTSVEGLLARAEMEEQLNMQSAARVDYDHALQLDSTDASIYAKRARLLLEMDLPQQAEKDINKAASMGYPLERLPKNNHK